jgi:hypothetical protein
MNKLYLRNLIILLFLALFSNYSYAVIRLKINFSSFPCYSEQNNNASNGELIIFRSNFPDAGNNYETVAARLTISGNLTDYYFNIGSTPGYYTCVFNKPSSSQASYVTTSPMNFYTSVYLSDGQTQDFSLSCTPPDLTPPVPSSAETNTDGTGITLNFNEPIESYSYFTTDEWIIRVDGAIRTITEAIPSGNAVLFKVSPAITNTQNVSVSLLYSDIIYDDGFNTSEPFNDFLVVNNVNSLLPIKLKNFEGKSSPNGNSITWITESEQNTGSIILEKSKNGATFYTITSFKPKGTGKYAYTDEQSNGRSFYRLKIIDLDGSIQVSDIIVVGSPELKQPNIKISPNPARNSISIQSDLQEATMRIIDTRGQEVKRFIWKSGNKVDVSFLKPGIYFIELSNGSKIFRDRLLIAY